MVNPVLAGKGNEMANFKKRIAELETLTPAETKTATGGQKSFAELLRQARKLAAAGKPVPQTRITKQMLADPLDREFYRQMHEARERARNLLLSKTRSP